MAGEGETQVDFQGHANSYSRFAAMMKWGAIASFIVAMLVVLMIA